MKTTMFRGIEHPYYLDEESLLYILEDKRQIANWLVHLGLHVNLNSPTDEAKKIQKIIKACMLLRDNLDISGCDKARIGVPELFSKSLDFDLIIKNAKSIQKEPLTKKSKFENLYIACATCFTKKERAKINNRGSSEFLSFLAAVYRLVEKHSSKDLEVGLTDSYMERCSKAFKLLNKKSAGQFL